MVEARWIARDLLLVGSRIGPSLHQRLDPVERWESVEPLPGRAWTDKYSNLMRVMKW